MPHTPSFSSPTHPGETLNDSFDITLPGTYKLAGDLLDEFLAFFPGPSWHGGADEYLVNSSYSDFPQLAAFAKANISPTATQYDTYLYFENWVDKKVTAAGKSTQMWNDPYNTLSLTGTAEGLNKDILLEMWDQTSAPQAAIEEGYSILNASYVPLYYTGSPYDYAQDLYEDWAPNLQFGGIAGWTVNAHDPGLPGASFEFGPILPPRMKPSSIKVRGFHCGVCAEHLGMSQSGSLDTCNPIRWRSDLGRAPGLGLPPDRLIYSR